MPGKTTAITLTPAGGDLLESIETSWKHIKFFPQLRINGFGHDMPPDR